MEPKRIISLIKLFAYSSLYMISLFIILRGFRYDFGEGIYYSFILDYQKDPVYLSRIIYTLLITFTIEHSELMWFVYCFCWCLDMELLKIYIIPKIGYVRAQTSVIFILFMPFVFFGLHGALESHLAIESITFFAVLCSLILYEKNPKYALYFQFFAVLIKELVPALIILWYFIEHQKSLKEIIQNIKKKNILLPVLVACEYIGIRIYYSLQFPNAYFTNPLHASSIYQYFFQNLISYDFYFVISRIFIAFSVFWLFLFALRKPIFHDYLWFLIFYFIIITTFGLIHEIDKIILVFPLIIPLFFDALDDINHWLEDFIEKRFGKIDK